MAEIKITKDNFDAEVLQAEGPVLVDFWASWCGPCKMLAPVLKDFAEEMAGAVKVGKVNVDDEPELASRFKVMSIPTLILFKNGEVVKKSIGVITKAEMKALVEGN